MDDRALGLAAGRGVDAVGAVRGNPFMFTEIMAERSLVIFAEAILAFGAEIGAVALFGAGGSSDALRFRIRRMEGDAGLPLERRIAATGGAEGFGVQIRALHRAFVENLRSIIFAQRVALVSIANRTGKALAAGDSAHIVAGGGIAGGLADHAADMCAGTGNGTGVVAIGDGACVGGAAQNTAHFAGSGDRSGVVAAGDLSRIVDHGAHDAADLIALGSNGAIVHAVDDLRIAHVTGNPADAGVVASGSRDGNLADTVSDRAALEVTRDGAHASVRGIQHAGDRQILDLRCAAYGAKQTLDRIQTADLMVGAIQCKDIGVRTVVNCGPGIITQVNIIVQSGREGCKGFICHLLAQPCQLRTGLDDIDITVLFRLGHGDAVPGVLRAVLQRDALADRGFIRSDGEAAGLVAVARAVDGVGVLARDAWEAAVVGDNDLVARAVGQVDGQCRAGDRIAIAVHKGQLAVYKVGLRQRNGDLRQTAQDHARVGGVMAHGLARRVSDVAVAADGCCLKTAQLDRAVQRVAVPVPVLRDRDRDVLTRRIAAEVVDAEAAARIRPERGVVLTEIIQAEVEIVNAGHLLRRAEQAGELHLDRVACVNLGVRSQRVAVRVLQRIADSARGDDLIGSQTVLLHLDNVAAGGQAGHGDRAVLGHGNALAGEAREGHLIGNDRTVDRNGAAVLGLEAVAGARIAKVEQNVVLGIQSGGSSVQTVHHHVGLDGRAVRAHGDDNHAGALGPDRGKLLAALTGHMGHRVIGHQHDGGACLVRGHRRDRAVVFVGGDGHNIAGIARRVDDGVVHIGQADLGVHEALNGHPVAEHIELEALAHIQIEIALTIGVQIDVRTVIDVFVKAVDRVLFEGLAVQVQIICGDIDGRGSRPLGEVPVGHAVRMLHAVEMVGVRLRHAEYSGHAVFILGHRGIREGVNVIGSKRARRNGRTGRGGDGDLIGLRDAGAEIIVHRGGLFRGGREIVRLLVSDGGKDRLHGVADDKQAGGAHRAVVVRLTERDLACIAVRAGHGDVHRIIGVLDPAAVRGVDLIHTLDLERVALLGNRELQAAVQIAVRVIALHPVIAGGEIDRVRAVARRDIREQIGLTLLAARVGVQSEFVHLRAVYAG